MSLILNNFEFGEPVRNRIGDVKGIRAWNVDLETIQGITESSS